MQAVSIVVFLVLGLTIRLGLVHGVWKCGKSTSAPGAHPPQGRRPLTRPGSKLPKPEKPCWGVDKIVAPFTLSSPEGESGNNDCTWNVTSPEGTRIKAVFTKMSLYYDSEFGGRCVNYVQMSSSSGRIGQYCSSGGEGGQLPTVVGPSNAMKVHYHSSGKTATISVEFSSIKAEPVTHTSCDGQLLTGDSLEIPENTDKIYLAECTWTIIAPPGKLVEGRFTGFEVANALREGDTECNFKMLNVSRVGGAYRTYCGLYLVDKTRPFSPLQRLISSDQTMTIWLRSLTHPELKATFTAIDPASVVLQYVVNSFYFQGSGNGDFGLSKTGGMVSIGYGGKEGPPSPQPHKILLHYQMVGQLIHDAPVGEEVEFSIAVPGALVAVKGKPSQNWIVKADGVYKQDGSADLSKSVGKEPDVPFKGPGEVPA